MTGKSKKDIQQDFIEEISKIVSEEIAKEIDAEILEELRFEGLTDEEKEAEAIIRRLKGQTKKFGIRDLTPGMVTNEILGVQPMQRPSGDIFTLNFRYKDAE